MRGPYDTAQRRALLEWAATRAEPWTLREAALATRPQIPEDLARHATRQVLAGLVVQGAIVAVGTRGPFGAKTYLAAEGQSC